MATSFKLVSDRTYLIYLTASAFNILSNEFQNNSFAYSEAFYKYEQSLKNVKEYILANVHPNDIRSYLASELHQIDACKREAAICTLWWSVSDIEISGDLLTKEDLHWFFKEALPSLPNLTKSMQWLLLDALCKYVIFIDESKDIIHMLPNYISQLKDTPSKLATVVVGWLPKVQM